MLPDKILLDLVNKWEEDYNHRQCVSGYGVCFKRCLLVLLGLSRKGYIRQTGSAGNYWHVLPTEAGVTHAKSLTIPKAVYLGTIADLNS
jgi:hypothetical protein